MISRHQYAFPRGVENQSVVPALNSARDHLAQGKRRATMAASILERGGGSRGIPKEHYRFGKDPFYSNGFIPTVKQLMERLLTGR